MYKFHEVAEIFPLMTGSEYEALVKDICQNGLREDILLYDGKIIDGRNRFRACNDAGVPPRFCTWDGSGSLVAFISSLNLHRRHLTTSQLAAVATEIEAEIAKEIAEESREKKRVAALKREAEKRGESPDQTIAILQNCGRKAGAEAAKMMGGKLSNLQ